MAGERVGVFNEWDPVKVMLLGSPTPYDAVSWWGGGTRCSTHPLERRTDSSS